MLKYLKNNFAFYLICNIFFTPTDRPILKVYTDGNYARLPIRHPKIKTLFALFSIENGLIPAGERKLVSTGLVILYPEGTYGQILPVFTAQLLGIDVGQEIVYNDFRNELYILVINNSKKEYKYYVNEQIAWLVIVKYPKCKLYQLGL